MVVLENTARMADKIHEHFKRSVETYWLLNDLCKTTDERELRRAIKEMMYDEYLHARYMRKYLKIHNMYPATATDEIEKKYLMIESDD